MLLAPIRTVLSTVHVIQDTMVMGSTVQISMSVPSAQKTVMITLPVQIMMAVTVELVTLVTWVMVSTVLRLTSAPR